MDGPVNFPINYFILLGLKHAYILGLNASSSVDVHVL